MTSRHLLGISIIVKHLGSKAKKPRKHIRLTKFNRTSGKNQNGKHPRFFKNIYALSSVLSQTFYALALSPSFLHVLESKIYLQINK